MTRVRMDKWLWADRFFKTRTLAERACELGRVEANGQRAKPGREVKTGDLLLVKNDGGDFQVEVLALSDVRGPAAVAQTLYRESEASREMRLKLAAERKAMMQFEGRGKAGHPNAIGAISTGFAVGCRAVQGRGAPRRWPWLTAVGVAAAGGIGRWRTRATRCVRPRHGPRRGTLPRVARCGLQGGDPLRATRLPFV